MKWVEIIKLQAPRHTRSTLCEVLAEELSLIPHTDGFVEARLLQDVHVETELSLLLDWDTVEVPGGGSELAKHAVHLLEDQGLIHLATLLDVSRPEET